MDVLEAVASRYSCRAFLPTPVPEKIVRDIIDRAARAPSAGNMQPWRIYAIAGKRVEELKALLAPRMATELPKGEGTDYTIYPEPLTEPYRARVKYVIGPDGSPLTIADLPPTNTRRWVIRRKAEVVAAVRGGLLSLDEACQRYTLTTEEFLSWQQSIDQHGLAGLRTTRIQHYRQ